MKKLSIGLLAALLVFSFTACGAKLADNAAYSGETGGAPAEAADQLSQKETEDAAGVNGIAILAENTQRKIIRNASFNLQTKDYDDTIARLTQYLESCGGYIQYSDRSGDKTQGTAYSSMTLRVPLGEYGSFLEFIPTIGNVTYSSEGTEDVTYSYYDSEARLRVFEAQEQRVLELLEQAQTMEDILAIETKLAEIRAEIESLTTMLNRYDDLIDYTTVNINIRQTSDYTVPTESFFDEVWQVVKDSANGVVWFLKNALFALIWALPYLLVGLAVFFAVRAGIRKRNSKKRPDTEQTGTDSKKDSE